MTPTHTWFVTLASALLVLGGCAGAESDVDAAPDTAFDAAADIATGLGAPEPAAEVSDPAPDTAEPAPEAIDALESDLPAMPACQGAWARPAWPLGDDPTFLRGPFLQAVHGNEATLVFRLRPPAEGDTPPIEGCVIADVANEEAPREVCALLDERLQAEVRLVGLAPDTEVTYRARAGATETAPFTFRSAPSDSAPVRLLVFADAHTNGDTIPLVAEMGLTAGVDLAVGVGDSVSQAEEAQFDAFFSYLRALGHRVPWWPVMGNHEGRDQPYFDAIAVPGGNPKEPHEAWYAARVGTVWFAVLELQDITLTAGLGIDLPEVAWLREQLASDAARSATWRLFFIHEPPWCAGWGHCDDPEYHGEYTLRTFLVPLAAEHDVAAIFSGHMHGYEHGVVDGVHLVISGGAGGDPDMACHTPDDFPAPWTTAYEHHALIVDAACDALTIEARRFDGTTLDTVVVPAP